MFHRKIFPTAILALLVTQSAFALNLQSYHFSDSYRYSFLDDSLQEKFEGKYVFTASLGHVSSPFYYSNSNLSSLKKPIIDYNNVLTTGFTYYLNRNVSLGIDLNAINNTVFGHSSTTMSDTVLKSKINLHRTDSFSFSINPQVIIPTGSKDNFSTMGSVSGSLSAVAEKSYQKLHFLGSIGALSSKNNSYVDVDHRQLLLTQLGASYDMSEKLNLNFETYRNIPLVNDKLQDEGKYFITAKHKTHERFSTYYGAGISGLVDAQTRTYSGFFGIKIQEAPVKETIAMVAAAPQRQVARPPVKDVYFDNDKYDLKDPELEKLNSYVDFINGSQGNIQHVMIEGHASKVGPALYNMKLSQKRANTVREYFIDHGVPKDILSTQGFGENFPQDPIEAKNRKVQINFHPKKKELL